MFGVLFLSHLAFSNNALNTSPQDCIDSMHIDVEPVSCYGLRDGYIEVDSIFGGTSPYYYSLDGISFTTHATFDRLWPGEYHLYIRDALGCERSVYLLVDEPEMREIEIVASDSSLMSGESVQLEITGWPDSVPISSVSWRPPALFQDQNVLEQTVTLTAPTSVAAIIYDDKGCNASDQVYIDVAKTKIYFPNVIKPSTPEESFFTVFSEDGLEEIENMQIFGRDGSIVFQKKGFQPNAPNEGWNGYWKGKPVTPGVYSWNALLRFSDGREEIHNGTITVVR